MSALVGKASDCQDAGFSLVEMLIVIAIAGLCAMLALPATRVLGKPTLLGVGHQILQAAQATRIAAITSGKRMTLDLNVKAGLIVSNAQLSRIRIPDDWMFSATVGIADNAVLGEESIVFFPDGGSGGGRVLLKQDGTRVTISVNWLTGIVTLAKGEAE